MIWAVLGIIAGQMALGWVIFFVQRADHRRYVRERLGAPAP
ncbi:hypothetical protein [Novacetimonas cocois]|nr:hypothetical protein [Novacetimonas cocois]